MKRFPHKLKPNEIATWPAHIIFFDTETRYHRTKHDTTIHELRLGVACYIRYRRDGKANCERWIQFTDKGSFWDFVCSHTMKRSKLYVVAHNLAFDFQVVSGFTELQKRGYLLQFVYESGHTRIIKYGKPTEKLLEWIEEGNDLSDFSGKRWTDTIVLMDDCNLFPGSIEKWGKALGLPKLNMPDESESDDKWFVYCKRDVEVMIALWNEWKEFLEEHKLGKFQYTIGSQAFSGFRHAYMHHNIYIHVNERATKLERRSYFGGRTEAFRVGKYDDRFYKLDVNSMYPAVMFKYEYPTCLIKYQERILSKDELRKLLQNHCVIAEVDVEVTEPVFPIREQGKNIYPTGELAVTLTTPELLYVLEQGWPITVYSYALYRKRPIFRWYVSHFYDLKRQYSAQGDRLRRQLVKLLLNSLYGKFGQRGYEDQVIGFCDPKLFEVSYGMNAQTKERFKVIKAGGVIIRSERTGEGFNSFCAIASHVTAYGRIYLWKLIKTAGPENVWYSDTDSLITNEEGLQRISYLLDDERLGYLKVEGMADFLEVYAPKDYVFGGKTTRKGIPSNAERQPDGSYEVELWPSLSGMLAEGQVETYVNKHIQKRLHYNVDWGILQEDGRVIPFHFGQSPLNF